MSRLDCTIDQLNEAHIEWGASDRTERFGQWLCNRYLKTGVSWPRLFYEESANDAYSVAYEEIEYGEDQCATAQLLRHTQPSLSGLA